MSRQLDHTIQRLGSTDDFDLIVRTAIAGFYIDRLPDCRDQLLRVVQDAPRGGAEGWVIMAMSMLSFDAWCAGEWDAARRTASEATALWGDAASASMPGTAAT